MDPENLMVRMALETLCQLTETAKAKLIGRGADKALKWCGELAQRLYGKMADREAAVAGSFNESDIRTLRDLLKKEPERLADLAQIMVALSQLPPSEATGGVQSAPAGASSSTISINAGRDIHVHSSTIGHLQFSPVDAERTGMLALLQMFDEKPDLAFRTAQAALRSNPGDSHAAFVAGVCPLLSTIQGLDRATVERCESNLSVAAEAGLAPQCAKPRAALRFDFFEYRHLPPPAPSLESLIELHGRQALGATTWPYDQINGRLGFSNTFRRIWEG